MCACTFAQRSALEKMRWFMNWQTLFDHAQEHVSGTVRAVLYKGNVIITGRSSEASLYDPAQSSMDIAGGYEPLDAAGFIKTHALRLLNWARQQERDENER